MKAKIAIVGSGNIGWALKQLLKKSTESDSEISAALVLGVKYISLGLLGSLFLTLSNKPQFSDPAVALINTHAGLKPV